LHRMGLDTSEREVRWLNELIAREQANPEHYTMTPERSDHD
jgi:hypothetical protein